MGTFTKLLYHIVFSTKHRHKSISPSFSHRLYEYIGGTIRAQNGHLLEIGGVDNHIHILAHLPATKSISDMVRDIKSNSSKWCNELAENSFKFEWQKGFGIFTVSYSQIELVRQFEISMSIIKQKALQKSIWSF
jgi:putative transposase